MKKEIVKIVITIFLSLLFMQACAGSKDRFNGRLARPNQTHNITNNSRSGVWRTPELSIYYICSSSKPGTFNITGNISVSEHITNTFSKMGRLTVRISFLDTSGTVVCTNSINPVYSINYPPPKKIKFDSNLVLPVETVAFCFSYSGEFRADGIDGNSDSRYIGHNPFY